MSDAPMDRVSARFAETVSGELQEMVAALRSLADAASR
jgi:hypothetical protein